MTSRSDARPLLHLSARQRTALEHIALLAEECAHPRFAKQTPLGSVVLTVNAGYE